MSHIIRFIAMHSFTLPRALDTLNFYIANISVQTADIDIVRQITNLT